MIHSKMLNAIKRLNETPFGIVFIKYYSNVLLSYIYKHFKSTNVAHPAVLMFELTNNCNLRCSTCPREYDFGKNMDRGSMDINKFKKIIGEAYPYIKSVILSSGLGEPFLYNHLNEAVRYIKNKNHDIHISISTNANLPKCAEQISYLCDDIDSIQLSIDGIGETYDKIRKGGSFQIFIDNTKKILNVCQESRTKFIFNMVVTKENYKQMKDLVLLAHDVGIRNINFSVFNLVSVTDMDKSYYEFYQTKQFTDELNKALTFSESFTGIKITALDFERQNGFKMCNFPWSHFYISWNGYVVPCCTKPFPKELHFGNAFENGLMNCLNNKSFRNFRSLWFSNRSPAFCHKCYFIDLQSFVPINNG